MNEFKLQLKIDSAFFFDVYG